MTESLSLVDRIRAALDEREQSLWTDVHVGPVPVRAAYNDERLRTVRAHREILDRHAHNAHFDEIWMCRKCGNVGWPCADVRSLAAIYFPESESTDG